MKFMLLHVGFEKPTPEVMAAWKNWFESAAGVTVEQGGLMNGVEISADGNTELGWDANTLTGFSIIDVDDRAAAEKLANDNPYITAIRVYEIRAHG
ncbi:MAG: YciI family protein [Pseudomonadota bacterium]